MPRRSKATLNDLINRIIYLYEKEKLTFKQIESILRAEGYDISKSSIHRAYRSYQESAELYKRMSQEIKALIEAVKENPTTDAIEAGVAYLSTKVLQLVKDIEKMDFNDPLDVITAVEKLGRTAERLTRFREEREKEAMKILKKGAEEGKVDPEILKKIQELYGA